MLDAYDAWKEMRNIDEEEMVDKQLEIQGNQTANFYKVCPPHNLRPRLERT